MAAPQTITPLAYTPDVETIQPDEVATAQSIVDTMRGISETTFKHLGHAIRAVHAKSHGLLRGELEVLGDLPPIYAQGLFSVPARYPVVMRLSTTPGDLLEDRVSTPRGLAIKVVGIPGERLPGTEGEVTQDFVLVNGPAFHVPDAKHFLSGLKLLAATTDKAPELKRYASTVLQSLESVVELFGGKNATLRALGGHPVTNILGETFYSQVPIRYGAYIAKIQVVPVSPELVALKGVKLDLADNPDGIRQAVIDHFIQNGGTWEIRAQLCIDLTTTPVEDASVIWPEDKSPFVTIGRIAVPSQPAWGAARVRQYDDGISFSPWHALAAHQPLGSIMRARKPAYVMSADFRASHNRLSVAEPEALDKLPE